MDEYQAVVMIGNISDGWEIVGPFPSWDDASEWADKNIGENFTWIATLYSPEQYFELEEIKTD